MRTQVSVLKSGESESCQSAVNAIVQFSAYSPVDQLQAEFEPTEGGFMKIRARKRQANKRLSLELKTWEWIVRTLRDRNVELVIYPASLEAEMLTRLAERHNVPYQFELA